MFEIAPGEPGHVRLVGRFDAEQADHAREALARLAAPATLDCSGLEYISSAGIAVIVETYKRLHQGGGRMVLVGMPPKVRNVFRYAGLDRLLEIQ